MHFQIGGVFKLYKAMAEMNYLEDVDQQDTISKLLNKSFAARTICEIAA